MRRAFIIGGSGQIGHAATNRLVDNGWNVIVASRSLPKNPIRKDNVEYVQVDRRDTQALKNSFSGPIDFLLDCLSFDITDATQLVKLSSQVGHICVISSTSVYKDKNGRTLDEAFINGFPELPVPIKTTQPTVESGPGTYSTKKIAMENHLQIHASCSLNILRPSAIYGPLSKHAREWFFVKRLLEGRKKIPLAYNAESKFHTTSVENLAAAILSAANGHLPTITNVVDPTAPSVREIGESIMLSLGIEAEIIGLPGAEFPPKYGRSPWAISKPFICELSQAYQSIGTYQELVGPTVKYLRDEIDLANWKTALPQLAWYPIDLFDYDGEDKILSNL